MPYRIDICSPPDDALDILIELGALDVETLKGGIAAIMPDGVTHGTIVSAFGGAVFNVSPVTARDDGSVCLLSPRAVHIRNIQLRLTDSPVFGSGHHPTTALCIEALEEILAFDRVDCMLDVGTGSGILALTALLMGVPQAIGLDTDPDALRIAAGNAVLNNCSGRLQLVLGGPDVLSGAWPLVVANVLTAPLIEMAPVLARRVASHGRLILSGIQSSLVREVTRAYQHLGMRDFESKTRAGWTMLMARPSW